MLLAWVLCCCCCCCCFFGFIYLHDHNCRAHHHPQHHHVPLHHPQHPEPWSARCSFAIVISFRLPRNDICICFSPLFFAPCTLRGLSRLRWVPSSLWSGLKCVLHVYIINRLTLDSYRNLHWFQYLYQVTTSVRVIPWICIVLHSSCCTATLIAGCLSMKYWVQVPTLIFVRLLRQCFSHTDPKLLIFLHFLKQTKKFFREWQPTLRRLIASLP